jgi:hypothetical protein
VDHGAGRAMLPSGMAWPSNRLYTQRGNSSSSSRLCRALSTGVCGVLAATRPNIRCILLASGDTTSLRPASALDALAPRRAHRGRHRQCSLWRPAARDCFFGGAARGPRPSTAYGASRIASRTAGPAEPVSPLDLLLRLNLQENGASRERSEGTARVSELGLGSTARGAR